MCIEIVRYYGWKPSYSIFLKKFYEMRRNNLLCITKYITNNINK